MLLFAKLNHSFSKLTVSFSLMSGNKPTEDKTFLASFFRMFSSLTLCSYVLIQHFQKHLMNQIKALRKTYPIRFLIKIIVASIS